MTTSRPSRAAKRNRPEREAVVVRREAPLEPVAPDAQHGVRLNAINWRYMSGLIVAMLGLIAIMMLRSEIFLVRGIAVSGTSYLDTREIFRYIGIAERHILEIDPEALREHLQEMPTIAEAKVAIGWPPDMVRIRIVERQPVLVWEQNGVEAWIDIHGRVLTAPPEDRPTLLRVVTRGVDEPINIDRDRIAQDVVDGARQLQELVPAERRLRYDPFLGLGFRDGQGWEAWFGSGRDMPVKILVYRRMVDDLLARGLTPSIVNVSNPDRPYCSGC